MNEFVEERMLGAENHALNADQDREESRLFWAVTFGRGADLCGEETNRSASAPHLITYVIR